MNGPTRRATLHALVLGLLLASSVGSGRAQSTEAELAPVVAEAASHYGISAAWLAATIRCETGGWRADVVYGPTRGAAGEMGAAQLHPQGELRRFLAVGYTDPFDPSQAIFFTAWRFAMGGASAWTCSR